MPRAFSVESGRSTFDLPELTKQHIQALMLDLDLSATDVLVRAIAQLYQREIMDESDFDLVSEITAIRQQLDRIEAAQR